MHRPLLSAAAMLTAATPLFAQVPVPPATDIFMAPIRLMPAAPAMGPARVASENPGGYDNQPVFGADGRAMLFTSSRDGTQTDIYFLEIQTRQIRRFSDTPESEYSPTVMPDDAGVSVIRVERDGTQRVWTLGPDGTSPRVLAPGVKPAGYHAWVDANRLAVYVLGQPNHLDVVEVSTGKATTIAREVGRTLARRPTGTVSFVQKVGSQWVVREFDPATSTVRDVTPALAGSVDHDYAWAGDGTLFMTRGTEIHWWRPAQTSWTLLRDPEIGDISRLAVSPDGRWMAIVAKEKPAGGVQEY
jgi:hypothetical protein